MKLFVLNSKPADPNGYIFQALVRALRRRTDVEIQVIRSDELRQVSSDRLNQSLLVYGGEELHQIPRGQILESFGRRAIWFTEDPYETERNQKSAELSKSYSVMTQKFRFLPKGRPSTIDDRLIPRNAYQKPRKLLFFSGTAWPNRKRLLNTLIDQWSNPEELDLHLVANQFVEQQLGVRNSKSCGLKNR